MKHEIKTTFTDTDIKSLIITHLEITYDCAVGDSVTWVYDSNDRIIAVKWNKVED